MQMINDRLVEEKAAGRQVVLIIDEAQALPEDCLEAMRLLTNLETEKSKLVQVVLFGQPELDTHLARPSVRQLRQRITFSYLLDTDGRQGSLWLPDASSCGGRLSRAAPVRCAARRGKCFGSVTVSRG